MGNGISSIWPPKKIGDLCKVSRGSSPRPIRDQRYFDGGTIPWIKIADATKSGKFLYKTKQYVNEFGASFSRLMPPGTILVAASGTLGYTQILGVEGCAHDGWLILTELNDLDRDYAYYTLQWMEKQFYNAAYGAAIQNINTEILRNTEIPCPGIKIQRQIASILSTYDDIIENNTRRIQILEEMAQRIYTEWFVHFRFPGHEKVKIVDSELGRIPSGWEFIKLGDLCSEKTTTVQPDAVDPDTPYVGLEHIPRKSITLGNWDNAEKITSTKKTFQVGDILFGKIRPYFHKVSVAPINGITSTDSIVIRAEEPNLFPLVLCCTSSVPFVDHATQTSNGTKMPRANWKVLVKYPIPYPNSGILTQFNGFINSIVSQTRTLMFKNRNLRQTRDLLLPKLISGEIDVSEMPVPVEIAA